MNLKLTTILAATSLALFANIGAARQPRDGGQPQAYTLYSQEQLRQGFEACPQLFPKQAILKPEWVGQNPSKKIRELCSNTFAVLYSGYSKTPVIVVEKLDRDQLSDAKGEERTDNFYPDPRIPADERASLDDFKGSGMDRGHLSPAADQNNVNSMAQSFALSNMIPQDPTNNRKIWSKIESDVRKFAMRAKGNVFVYSGPVFASRVDQNEHASIGRGKVWVPSHLYKVVYDEAGNRAWAYVLENSASAVINKPMTYAEFVKVMKINPLNGIIVQ